MKDNLTAHGSSDYDAQVANTIPCYDSFHEETLDLVAVVTPKPAVWIDTGAGTGTLIEKALPRFPSSAFYLADPAPGMLTVAREKLAGQARVTIMEPVDSAGLRSPVGVDVITAIQAHHYMKPDERKAATENCCRLLRDGGLFVTFENVRPLTDRGTEIGKARWARFQVDRGRDPKAVERHLQRFGVDYFPLTIEEHLQMLRACGFRVVELFWYAVMQAGFYCIK